MTRVAVPKQRLVTSLMQILINPRQLALDHSEQLWLIEQQCKADSQQTDFYIN